ncbi:hypothetical protein HPP92_001443 [Vanilla planifolia]|uniref:Uncharacterized protein n=1 Tax=Vanilla planifolia TaxID=51239 RepID=A0A835S3C7_VANPL|nr:hypothetical protein HPP92_001443 [Vanilla planifolia]
MDASKLLLVNHLILQTPRPPGSESGRKKESTQDWQEVSCEEGLTKRRALDKEEDGKHDEDWLRYSELLPKVVDVHEIAENDLPMTEAPTVEKTLSRFAIDIEGECIPITGPSGDRVYAQLQLKEMADRGLNNLGMDKTKDGLISEPISAIIGKLDHEVFAKAFEEEAKLPSHPTITEQLWVEKYAPSSFSELLSDDQTNRESKSMTLKVVGVSTLWSSWLGKTTLAHVAAKHCGYRVVEVIDEIDGSLGEGKGAVEVILKMYVGLSCAMSRGIMEGISYLKVICICNDLYAPALRPIRQIAK